MTAGPTIKNFTYAIWVGLLSVLILAFLSSCSPTLPVSTQAVSPTPALTTELPPSTPTPQPGPTAEPPVLILYAPSGADPTLMEALQPDLSELAAQSGLEFAVRTSLAPADISPNVRLVVALPPAGDLTSLVNSAPDTGFLSLGLSGLPESDNLVQIGAEGGRLDLQAFLAGYLAAVVTSDWRVGIISDPGTAAGQAFRNGVVYFCGLCRPSTPPFDEYPLLSEISPSAPEAEKQAALDAMAVRGVKTVYVAPGIGDEGLYEYMAQAGVQIIGSGAPPAGAESQWIASIEADLLPAALEILPGLLGGETGDVSQSSVAITHRNPSLFSPGRQQLVEQFMRDLVEGYIDTGAGAAESGGQ